ncbi:retrovirus-related pol polyprotein from transposon TNT 1-94 [Tanacetum coccineum]
MQMVGCNVGNQFGQYAGQMAGNQNRYNAVQNVRNQVVQNVVQNLGVQNVGNHNELIVVPGIANQNVNQNGNGNVVAAWAEGNGNENNKNQVRCYNCKGMGHIAKNCTVRPRRRDAVYLQTQLLIAQKEEVGIQLQAKEFDLMAATGDIEEIEEQASTSSTQTDKAPVYDSDGSAEPHMIQQNNSNVISVESSVEHNGGTVEQHPTTVEETHAYFKSLYNNLVTEVEKVNTVNHKMKETNVALTIELARYKNQEKCFEINQEKYDKLERAAKFVRDFKSLAKEADASLDKHKALKFEIECLLRAVVSQDIMFIVQSSSVVETSDLQTELERTKEKMENCTPWMGSSRLPNKVRRTTRKHVSSNACIMKECNMKDGPINIEMRLTHGESISRLSLDEFSPRWER